MWYLVKNELHYFGIFYLVPFLLIAEWILNTFFYKYQTAYILVLFVFIIYFLSILHEKGTIKTDRMHILLPLTIRKTAITRIAVTIIPWLVFAGLSLALSALMNPERIDNALITTTWIGVIISFAVSYIIIKDIFNSIKRIKLPMKGIISTLILGATLLVIYFCALIDPEFREGIILYIIYPWGLLLTAVAIISFSKRKNFT